MAEPFGVRQRAGIGSGFGWHGILPGASCRDSADCGRRLWQNLARNQSEGRAMNDAGTMPPHMLEVRELTAQAFAPYGEVIAPLRTGGQGTATGSDPEASTNEAKLVLSNGVPRLWIMHLPHVGLGFTRIARHRQVTQCLGSLGGKEWLIGVAPPGDLSDDARPRIEDIAAFRVPGDRLIKLHVATWHAGPHFVHDECQFMNLENLRYEPARFSRRIASRRVPLSALTGGLVPCLFR